jgi:GNAT superfamily N-acetyltransferase
MTYVSEGLSEHHERATFRSGVAELDRWLVESALHAQAMRTARTFVWHEGDLRVLAYFSLAAHVIARAELSAKLARGSPDRIPAILLARLALDQRLRGTGLGGELLWDALSRSVAASQLAGARLVVVDAIDARAASFYVHHGFQVVPENPFRLVQKMNDIAAALGL